MTDEKRTLSGRTALSTPSTWGEDGDEDGDGGGGEGEGEEEEEGSPAAAGSEFDVGRMSGAKDRYTGKRADVRAKFKKGVNAVKANNAASAKKKKKGAGAAAPRKGNKVPV